MEPLEGLYDSGAELHHFDEEQDSNKIRIKVTSRIRIGIKVNSWIQIRVKVMRIRNTFPSCSSCYTQHTSTHRDWIYDASPHTDSRFRFDFVGSWDYPFKVNKTVYKKSWGLLNTAGLAISRITVDLNSWYKNFMKNHFVEMDWINSIETPIDPAPILQNDALPEVVDTSRAAEVAKIKVFFYLHKKLINLINK
jgi:hypothetical protein